MKYALVCAALTIYIIVIAIILSIKCKEPFAQQYALVDNEKNVKQSIKFNKELFHQMILIKQNKGYINKYTINIMQLDADKDIQVYVDPYIDYYIFKNRTYTTYKKGIFLCLTPTKLTANECIWNMQNKTIAYAYISDYLFIQAIVKGYRQDISKVKLIKISDDELLKGKVSFDMFITYAVIDSDYMQMLQRSLYYMSGFTDVDINRIKAFYPFIEENYDNLRTYFTDANFREYVSSANDVLIPTMRYNIIPLSSLLENTLETFITRYERAEKAENTLICQKSSDCPYYQANSKYANKRGGCIKGKCELPVGVKTDGFYKYEDKGLNSPLCYDCKDTTDTDCCHKQGKADYVFANDRIDRLQYSMQTVIDILDINNF